ncbi:MAG: diaminopimelate epimerase [Bacteroidetes bacterium]|nr:diaminopimelate epimerase [Bacteroidota bacterium]
MIIKFFKYQGTGNDFILIDNRQLGLAHNMQTVFEKWCDRRFGIGADGLIFLENADGCDFRMVYFNSDGRQSSMCGNGGRCVVRFAKDLGIIGDETRFVATDGHHEAKIIGEIIELHMQDVSGVETTEGDFYLNTGSPHYVRYRKSGIEEMNLVDEARAIRYNNRFKAEGTNVNIVQDMGSHLEVRTYERGVEDETYSCGTGVTAVALVNHICSASNRNYFQKIHTPGGNLEVRFHKNNDQTYSNVWLCGPATYVFEGEIALD